MKKFSDSLHKISTGWVTVSALFIFVLFTALVLPKQAQKADASSDSELGSPDLSFFYTPSDLYKMAESYGEAGRSDYIRARFTFDLVWPLVYTAFLVTSISWLFRKGFHHQSRWQLSNLIPVLGMILDFLENISTSLVMYKYPERTFVVDFLAPWFTAAKWILVSGSFLLLVFGATAALWEWIRGKNN